MVVPHKKLHGQSKFRSKAEKFIISYSELYFDDAHLLRVQHRERFLIFPLDGFDFHIRVTHSLL